MARRRKKDRDIPPLKGIGPFGISDVPQYAIQSPALMSKVEWELHGRPNWIIKYKRRKRGFDGESYYAKTVIPASVPIEVICTIPIACTEIQVGAVFGAGPLWREVSWEEVKHFGNAINKIPNGSIGAPRMYGFNPNLTLKEAATYAMPDDQERPTARRQIGREDMTKISDELRRQIEENT